MRSDEAYHGQTIDRSERVTFLTKVARFAFSGQYANPCSDVSRLCPSITLRRGFLAPSQVRESGGRSLWGSCWPSPTCLPRPSPRRTSERPVGQGQEVGTSPVPEHNRGQRRGTMSTRSSTCEAVQRRYGNTPTRGPVIETVPPPTLTLVQLTKRELVR